VSKRGGGRLKEGAVMGEIVGYILRTQPGGGGCLAEGGDTGEMR
jgi:hypothetical protein